MCSRYRPSSMPFFLVIILYLLFYSMRLESLWSKATEELFSCGRPANVPFCKSPESQAIFPRALGRSMDTSVTDQTLTMLAPPVTSQAVCFSSLIPVIFSQTSSAGRQIVKRRATVCKTGQAHECPPHAVQETPLQCEKGKSYNQGLHPLWFMFIH